MEEKDKIQTERYLAGDLIEQEQRSFEARLVQEPELQNHLNWQQSLRSNRSRQSKKAALLQMLEEERKSRSKAKVKPLFSRLRIAASLAILVLAGGYLFRDALFVAPDRIQAVALSTEMGDNDPELVKVIQSFNQGAYETVVAGLKDLPLADLSPNLIRAKGIAQIEMAQLDGAIETFQYLKENHAIHISESEYYLGVIYYRKKDWAASKKALEAIPEKSSYYERAQKLWRKIAS